MTTRTISIIAGLSLALAAHAARAARADEDLTLSTPNLSLDSSAAFVAAARQEQPATTPTPTTPARLYGEPGGWWLTVGGGVADDFQTDTDIEGFVAFSTFLATSLEFSLELGGWYFIQPGDDTGGLSASGVIRWHFWMSEDRRFTTYLDGGIGILSSFDDTPPGGSSFNFLPRAGVGLTYQLDDSGTRLQAGVRWHHVSNARFNGDSNNPGRDSVMIYAGFVFPL